MNRRNSTICLIFLMLLGQIGAIGFIEFQIIPVYENKKDILLTSNSSLNSAVVEYIIPSVPHYYQDTNYWCGIASLEMVYDFYGPEISQLEIADVARADSSYGAYTSDLRRSTHFSLLSTSVGNEMAGSITGYTNRSIGYGAFEQQYLSVNNLIDLIGDGHPILVLQHYDGNHYSGHFRVVIGYVKNGDTITQLIVHDPWDLNFGYGIYHGPNVYLNYATFVDLWSRFYNWALFICPWDVIVSCSSKVKINSIFTVTANVEYILPSTFTPGYIASASKATINLPAGFSLAPGEMYTKNLNPVSLPAGDVGTVTWQVVADVLNTEGIISVNASGIVSGTAYAHSPQYPSGYTYNDLVGGNGSNLVKIVESLPKNVNLVPIIIISAAIIGVVVISILIIIIIRRRKVPE
jgi:hypothetical protein